MAFAVVSSVRMSVGRACELSPSRTVGSLLTEITYQMQILTKITVCIVIGNRLPAGGKTSKLQVAANSASVG